jgi:hypothetical protein
MQEAKVYQTLVPCNSLVAAPRWRGLVLSKLRIGARAIREPHSTFCASNRNGTFRYRSYRISFESTSPLADVRADLFTIRNGR